MTNRSRGAADDMVQLRNGVYVPRRLHDELREHIRPRLRSLKGAPRLKAKEMVAGDYYATLNPWTVGACVSHWESSGELPLRFLGCPHCSVRYYEVT